MNVAIIAGLVSALVVIVGWFAVHWLTISRDALAKRRELRAKYLLEAYRKLEDSTGRSQGLATDAWRALEGAVADIQLLGTRAQIETLLAHVRQFKDDRGAVEPVLELIRYDLRKELGLETKVPQVHQFRLTPLQSAPVSQANLCTGRKTTNE